MLGAYGQPVKQMSVGLFLFAAKEAGSQRAESQQAE
jgi:hypothetical protein